MDGILAALPAGGEDAAIAKSGLAMLQIIASSSPQIFESASEPTVHKFKVRVSSLLKSKSPVSRWFAAYLVKLAVPASQPILASHGASWATMLIHILELPDPVTTHAVVIQALQALFASTVDRPELVREITTPRIPSFIKQLLGILNGSGHNSRELKLPAVHALSLILDSQPASLRPSAAKIHDALVETLVPSCSLGIADGTDQHLISTVAECFARLHMAAAKGTSAAQWHSVCLGLVAEIHITMDSLVEPYIKEDKPNAFSSQGLLLGLVQLQNTSSASPLDYVRILTTLFTLLQSVLTTPTTTAVKIPLGALADLCDRIYSCSRHTTPRPGVEKAHRQMFLASIDSIHLLTTKFAISLIPVIGQSLLPHFDMLFHHATTVPEVGGANHRIQLAFLTLVTKLFVVVGRLPAQYYESLTKLVQVATQLASPSAAKAAGLADYMSNPSLFTRKASDGTKLVVGEFLAATIVAAPGLPLAARSEIDRYFILTSSTRGLVASALYPGVNSRYSIAPLAMKLTRSETMAALLHPRLPPLAKSAHSVAKTASFNPEADETSKAAESMDVDEDEWVKPGNGYVQSEESHISPEPVVPVVPAEIPKIQELHPRERPESFAPVVRPAAPASVAVMPVPTMTATGAATVIASEVSVSLAPQGISDEDSDEDVEIAIVVDDSSDDE